MTPLDDVWDLMKVTSLTPFYAARTTLSNAANVHLAMGSIRAILRLQGFLRAVCAIGAASDLPTADFEGCALAWWRRLDGLRELDADRPTRLHREIAELVAQRLLTFDMVDYDRHGMAEALAAALAFPELAERRASVEERLLELKEARLLSQLEALMNDYRLAVSEASPAPAASVEAPPGLVQPAPPPPDDLESIFVAVEREVSQRQADYCMLEPGSSLYRVAKEDACVRQLLPASGDRFQLFYRDVIRQFRALQGLNRANAPLSSRIMEAARRTGSAAAAPATTRARAAERESKPPLATLPPAPHDA